MHFYVIASLLGVNIFKASYYLQKKQEQPSALSRADIKIENYNQFLFDLIYSKLDFRPNMNKINELRAFVKDIGKMAA